ncbi:hypothetical protein VNO80_06662 [Phaseolus coccineus]|uniref:Uncharacterized protein n=1 Tax=Phaseolus coccineus TaxID=3886 RepID=A0AAN9RJ59_PHACN
MVLRILWEVKPTRQLWRVGLKFEHLFLSSFYLALWKLFLFLFGHFVVLTHKHDKDETEFEPREKRFTVHFTLLSALFDLSN